MEVCLEVPWGYDHELFARELLVNEVIDIVRIEEHPEARLHDLHI